MSTSGSGRAGAACVPVLALACVFFGPACAADSSPRRATEGHDSTPSPAAGPPEPPATSPSSTAPAAPPPSSEAAGELAPAPRYADWPRIESALRTDPEQEAWIAGVVGHMTLAQKVGQMTQAEAPQIDPDDVRAHYIGSVLSGAGAWPATKTGSPAAWTAVADAYWEASTSTDMATQIPITFAVDAVHGNQKQFGATLFPHNIGLGAARDADLTERIGAFTTRQMRASGVDYTFAPCVAVPQDDRWGRTYEGYSESPSITRLLAAAITRGLMDVDASGTTFSGAITSAKHFLGDGSTDRGLDQGISSVSEQELINVHAQGYYAAIEAGTQTIMASYSSWVDPAQGAASKVHGSKYLLTTVLKEKIGFDGFVISDYRGIGQVPGCTETRCAQAINAGIDMVMIPETWKEFIRDTIALVEAGEVPMSRIDDAVTRILRVKLRAGLFARPKPSLRPDAGDARALVARELGREAAQKSAVLLKNNGSVLPLDPRAKVLVVGKSADSLPNQNGGWSLGWQSTPSSDKNTNASFPNGETILAGIERRLERARVSYSETARAVDVTDYDAVIAVIGELPYAEYGGDIVDNPLRTWGPSGSAQASEEAAKRTLEHAVRHPEDLAVLDAVAHQGVPVVTVFLSGRPLHTNKELNRSDAFVAAWLPGTEGGALADLLIQGAGEQTKLDFQGRLSYSWPRHACQTSVNVGRPDYDPLFPFGHGLRLADTTVVPALDEAPGPAAGCAD